MSTTEIAAALAATPVIDADHPAVAAYAREYTQGLSDPTAQAVRLYYAVRDGIRYDPYSIEMTVAGCRASTILQTGRGWCVTKAVLLAACCRAAGIPARLGFADVKNHLSTARMRALMGTDEFLWHGYTAILLAGNWVKATPAFNIELCERFRLRPLEFDGGADSIYHAFDLDGRQHMEYLRYRGEYLDAPIAAIDAEFKQAYPAMMRAMREGDFEREVGHEVDQTPR